MADVEMKSDDKKPDKEEAKKEDEAKEEPKDKFYELKKCLVVCEKSA
jgi:hypothetical protein